MVTIAQRFLELFVESVVLVVEVHVIPAYIFFRETSPRVSYEPVGVVCDRRGRDVDGREAGGGAQQRGAPLVLCLRRPDCQGMAILSTTHFVNMNSRRARLSGEGEGVGVAW